jgi:hypothetical protein
MEKRRRTEGERSNVEEENVGDVSGKDTGLDGSSDGDGLVRVDTLRGLSTEDTLDGLDDLGHSGHSSNEDDVVDVGRPERRSEAEVRRVRKGKKERRGRKGKDSLDTSVGESLLARVDSLGDESTDETLELRSGHLLVDVLGSRGVGGDVRKVDV